MSVDSRRRKLTRRALLLAGGAAGATAAWTVWNRARRWPRQRVFIAQHAHYDQDLRSSIREGLLAVGVQPDQLCDRLVLLKPNLVEPDRNRRHMTTHPAVVVAAVEQFRSWGARVLVGEAPGHVRDTDMALEESGLAAALAETNVPFADLNYEDVTWRPNTGRSSGLAGFFFPASVCHADLIVSMPKLKTHHWVGMTAAMKNLYGTLPGIEYGWPKNVLHHHGIPETVVDICASLPRTLAIVDAIECMEGDGPILGSSKQVGLLLVGANLPAVDATAARIMGLDPQRISYLRCGRRLGPLSDASIDQVGIDWRQVVRPFRMLDRPHLRALQASPAGPLIS